MRYLSVAILTFVFAFSSRARIAPSAPPADAPPIGLTLADWSQIQAEYVRHRHTAFPDGNAFKARTRELGWNTRFNGRGFEIRPDDSTWRFGLELLGHSSAHVTVNKNRVAYAWDSNLEEWFVNETRGLEHGFTIRKKSGPLELQLAICGDLRAVGAGTAIRFLDSSGAAILTYSEAKAWDATGRSLPVRMEVSNVVLRLSVDDRGARYPVTIDPIVQQAYLKPAAAGTTQAGDNFGIAVAISGDTVLVGADEEDSASLGINSIPNENASNSGAAFVFVRESGAWTQQAYLKPAAVGTTQVSDLFGLAVSLSGDTAVVGAYGENSSTLGVNTTPNEGAVDSGAAYVFVRTAGVWAQQAYLKPAAVGLTQAGDQFGRSVRIAGDTLAVGAYLEDGSAGINGAPNENASDAGATYVFTRTGAVWSQQAYLKPTSVGVTQTGDNFGRSIGISGDTVVVGACLEDSSSLGINSTPNELATDSGAAFVFVRSGTSWNQEAYLKPASVGTTQAGDFFGCSVSLSGDTAVVGAYLEDSSTVGINSEPNEIATDSGSAYVFARNAGQWSQQAYLKPARVGSLQNGDTFGRIVSVSGDLLVAGAIREDSSTLGIDSLPDENAENAGAAYVFARTAGAWTQQAYLKPASVGATPIGDFFGLGVSVSGNTILVGAYFEDSSSLGINTTPNENATDAGAAFVFVRTGPTITEVIDAGSLRPEIAASAWITIKGTTLARTTRIWIDSDFVQGRLPTALDGVSVTIDGRPAAVYYISPAQINVLSGALTRTGPVPVVVTTADGSATFTATVKERTPSWFMLDPENRKYVAAVNSDGSIVGKTGLYPSAPNFTKPLAAGGRGLIYGTSWGVANPPVPEGSVFSGAYNIAGATIKIGGVNVAIEFAGVVTPGLFQFNIVAPDLPPGDYLIEGAIGTNTTQPGAYITLGPP